MKSDNIFNGLPSYRSCNRIHFYVNYYLLCCYWEHGLSNGGSCLMVLVSSIVSLLLLMPVIMIATLIEDMTSNRFSFSLVWLDDRDFLSDCQSNPSNHNHCND
jgi:hypothetical protein